MKTITQPDPAMVFDRVLVRRRRDRAAADFGTVSFLFRETAERLMERLDGVRRRFANILDLGCRDGALTRRLRERAETDMVIAADLSPAMARMAGAPAVVADEEWLPFAENRFDLVVSNLGLHWVNDLPGALIQINRCLKPDGFFLAAMAGGDSLHELRRCLLEAEAAITGGASPRVSPFADLRDAAGLLQRAGFALPVADVETITVDYQDPFRLLFDLRGMGETNAVVERSRRPAPRRLFLEAAQRYRDRYGDADGRVAATFQILYLAGWAPDASQPRPLRPGSAKVRLADALGTTERSAGDKAGPG